VNIDTAPIRYERVRTIKRYIDASRILHESRQFRFWIAKNGHSLESLDSDDSEKKVLRQIRWIVDKYVHASGESSLKTFIKELLNQVPAYKNQKSGFYSSLSENLIAETRYQIYEESTFSKLPTFLFASWYNTIKENRLRTFSAFTLLASFWIQSANKPINRYRVGVLTDFNLDTIDTHLEQLCKANILTEAGSSDGHPKEYMLEPKYHEQHDRTEEKWKNKWDHEFCDSEESYFYYLQPLRNITESDYVALIPNKHGSEGNPLVFRTGQAHIHIHNRMLRMDMLAACMLSKQQLLAWLNLAYTAKPGRVLSRIATDVNTYINKSFSRPVPKTTHYGQIIEVFPLLHYVGRRELQFDFKLRAGFVARHIKDQMEEAAQDFFLVQSAIRLMYPDKWDIVYFLQCLESDKPGDKWVEKYPDQEIILRPLMLPSTEKEVVANSGNDSITKPIVLEPGKWQMKIFEELSTKIQGAVELKKIIRVKTRLATLQRYMNHLIQSGNSSFQFKPRVFQVKTHRIYTTDPSSQNIPKSIRPAIMARSGHQLLMIDITEMELSIINHLARKHGFLSPQEQGPTFESMVNSTGLARKKVKAFFYPYFYGAGKKLLKNQPNLNLTEVNVLIEELNKYPALNDFRKTVISKTRYKGHTPPTPLGFRIPLCAEQAYRGFPYLIQASAAEIFREWILELHRQGLSSNIVNLIHDEVILEVPNDQNLYNLTLNAHTALQIAARNIVGDLHFRIHAFASKQWDKNNAASIQLKETI
jgi:hypothetical protein